MTGDRGSDPVVMLCYDGSNESANAIDRAGELLAPQQAKVVTVWSGLSTLMLHAPLAGPPPGPLAEGAEMIDEPELQKAERRAAEGAERAAAAGFEAQPVALRHERNVWHTLRRYALEEGVSVLALGARGRSRVAAALLGAVSAGLVNHAPAPVLVVPATATGRAEGPVVFCADGSDNGRRGITVGRRLLRGPGLVLTRWHSWAVSVPYMVVGAGSTLGIAQEIDEASRHYAEENAAAGAEMASTIDGDCEYKAVRYDGAAWRGLLDAATDRDASAIVVGARGLTGIAHMLGSVSGAIVQHSPLPVLVVPPAPEGE